MKIKPFKIISTIFYSLIIAFVFLMAGSLVLNRLNTPLEYKLYSVQSGSMSPAIPVGSLIVVAPSDSYREHDIINFGQEGRRDTSVTHRVVYVSRDEDLGTVSYRTQGDANQDADIELVRSDRVNGKVIFHLPYLGYPVSFAQTQTGFILLVIVPATIIIYSELVNIGQEIKAMFNKDKPTTTIDNKDVKVEKVYQKPKIRTKKSNHSRDG